MNETNDSDTAAAVEHFPIPAHPCETTSIAAAIDAAGAIELKDRAGERLGSNRFPMTPHRWPLVWRADSVSPRE